MSVSSSPLEGAPRNALYRLAGAGSALLGLLFLVGASGHLSATWPMVVADPPENRSLWLLLPGLILAITGLFNVSLCWGLWAGKPLSRRLAFIVNLLATFYLAYLLHRGVPDHPIGFFLAFASSQVILLGAIRAGFTWPAVEAKAASGPKQ